MNIGTEEYFYSGYVCLIEWPLKVEDILPEAYTFVKIEVTGPESRTFHLKKHDGKA
jgi:tRNA threonylcarbamoyladenosine biosynthesis protein TsaE